MAAANLVAGISARELHRRPQLLLGRAAGRSLERVYAALARRHRQETLDCALCRTVNLDEDRILPPDQEPERNELR